MTSPSRQIEQARQRFYDFHGFAPGPNQVGAIDTDAPGAAFVVGELEAVTYKPLDGSARYKHVFREDSRPGLAVSYDGKNSYIVGGNYEFTGRGFVDRKGGTMPGQMLFMNPRTKRAGKKGHKSMTRKQAKYFGKKRRHHRRRHALALRSNPRAFSRARAALSSRSGLGTPGDPMSMIAPAAIGAAGALGIDYLWNQFGQSMPATLQSGIPMYAAKGALAIGLGYAVGSFAGKRTGMLIALGGLTVQGAALLGEVMAGTLGTGGQDPSQQFDPSQTGGQQLQRYVSARRDRIARYVSGNGGMGYINPGRTARVY